MGCDIHIIVAKCDGNKVELLVDMDDYGAEGTPQEEWEFVWRKWRVARGRNYERFAALSGVRGTGPEANDWPDWAQETFHDSYEDQDRHSHTCYPVREAAKIFLETADGGDMSVLARAAPEATFFGVDPNRPDLDQIYVLIAYDN